MFAWQCVALAGFTDGMPIKIRVMPDCIVITTQNTRELYGCAEGLPNFSLT
ncbi:SymE family type I addiction module toxin [Citrobacter farmeri]|uniref:SymE family type I addiction module toxin n=1 Tax=Citrobacter amalonaticus TaxID=35703 RepID=UPI0039B6D775